MLAPIADKHKHWLFTRSQSTQEAADPGEAVMERPTSLAGVIRREDPQCFRVGPQVRVPPLLDRSSNLREMPRVKDAGAPSRPLPPHREWRHHSRGGQDLTWMLKPPQARGEDRDVAGPRRILGGLECSNDIW